MKNLSIALWTTSEKFSQENSTVGERRELHFNIWNINESHAIDIGIMLPKSLFDDGGSLFIFIPSSCKLTDLCPTLTDNKYKSLYSIFNCFFSVNTCENGHKCCVAELDGNTAFCLTSSKYEKIDTPDLHGSVFKVTPGEHKKCTRGIKNYYMRFRAQGRWINSCYFNSEKESSRFQNFTERVYFLDFRYNNRRILPDQIAEYIVNNHQIALDLIQFFYICPASYKVELTKKEISNMRCLERSLWQGYFPDLSKLSLKDAALAYQRKTIPKHNERLTDFSFLIKISYQGFRWKKAFVYFAAACLLSFGISYLATMCYEKWHPKTTPTPVANQGAGHDNATQK